MQDYTRTAVLDQRSHFMCEGNYQFQYHSPFYQHGHHVRENLAHAPQKNLPLDAQGD